ncbi:MAG: hypothetical protein IMY80_01085 [Chloroflexi bacterium]|nr:hypothetical protein [Chloroflexota bacterium]
MSRGSVDAGDDKEGDHGHRRRTRRYIEDRRQSMMQSPPADTSGAVAVW